MRGLRTAVLVIALSVASSIAAQTYRVEGKLAAGDGGWDLASVDSVEHRLYVARTDGVTAVDLQTGVVTDMLVEGKRVHAALAIPGTHEVISTNGGLDNAVLFDGRTGRVRAIIPTGKNPDAAEYDPASRTIWVMNPGSGDVTVIDPVAGEPVSTIPVGGSLELAVADGHGKIFVNVEDRNEVVVLDTRKRKVSSRFQLRGCEEPTGIAYDPALKQIVSACGNGVAVISSPQGRQIARLPIGQGADGAALDARRHIVLVPAGRDGNLTAIKLGAKPKALGQIATAVSARTVAMDQATGRSYMPSAKLEQTSGDERPKPIPGTFQVIVVGPANR